MATTMDGAQVNVGDAVYDVILGTGTVTELTLDNRIKVRFSGVGREGTFTSGGVSGRWNARTLYWRDPVLVAPLKSDAEWARVRSICLAVVAEFQS
jgi:hypothetical protein